MKFYMSILMLFCLGAVNESPADDVLCNKCVDSTDLANKSVTQAKIRNGSVTAGKIKKQAVTASKIKNGAVTVSKVAPELSNSLGTYCLPGQAVVGKNQDGNLVCELTGVLFASYKSRATSVAGVTCPRNSFPVSANCGCDNANGLRNYGILFSCQMAGNGAIVGCFDEGVSYDFRKPSARASVTVMCASENPSASASATVAKGDGKLATSSHMKMSEPVLPNEEMAKSARLIEDEVAAYNLRIIDR